MAEPAAEEAAPAAEAAPAPAAEPAAAAEPEPAPEPVAAQARGHQAGEPGANDGDPGSSAAAGAAEAAAEVFAGNNIRATLTAEDAPTLLVTYATVIEKSAYGLVFTASHNPPDWNGLKVFHGDGSLLLGRNACLAARADLPSLGDE